MAKEETLKTFEKLYQSTYKEVALYVVCHVKNPLDVEDILQTIYLHAYKSLQKNKEITINYLLGIAKHKIKDYYRFRYKDKIVSLFEKKEIEENTLKSKVDIEECASIKWDTEEIWEYLKKKKIIIFQIFYLYYVLELKIKEIAKYLNLTESNVKHHLYRTLEELKQKYQKEE